MSDSPAGHPWIARLAIALVGAVVGVGVVIALEWQEVSLPWEAIVDDRASDDVEPGPRMGDLLVVGKSAERIGNVGQYCFRFRAFGGTEETCLLASGNAGQCYERARIGQPLPQCAR